MRCVLSRDGVSHRVEALVGPDPGGLTLRIAGAEGTFAARQAPGGWTITRGRRTVEAGVVVQPSGEVVVQIAGISLRFRPDRGRRPASTDGTGFAGDGPVTAEVRTPMPGKVVRVLRGEGDPVASGEGVLVFEAMKMQNEIRAPRSGVVANMKAVAGAPMEGGELLFAVEPAAAS